MNVYSCHLPPPGSNSDAFRIAAAKVVASKTIAPLLLGGDLNNQGGIGIKSIIKRDYNSCGYGVDHLITDQTCAIHKLIGSACGAATRQIIPQSS